MKNIVLDTNAYSNLLRGDQKVLQIANQAEKIYMPIFVIAELIVGFKYGSRESWNQTILQEFMSRPTVHMVFPTEETVEIFSEITVALRKSGKPIPTHDIWIAASAIEMGSTIVTYDLHFQYVQKARVWNEL